MSEVKLTKSIPLSIITGALVQTGLIVWYMAHLDARVEHNTEKIAERAPWMVSREQFEQKTSEELIKLRITVKSLDETCDELNQTVKQLIRNERPIRTN